MRRLFDTNVEQQGFSEAALAPMVDLFTLLVIAVSLSGNWHCHAWSLHCTLRWRQPSFLGR